MVDSPQQGIAARATAPQPAPGRTAVAWLALLLAAGALAAAAWLFLQHQQLTAQVQSLLETTGVNSQWQSLAARLVELESGLDQIKADQTVQQAALDKRFAALAANPGPAAADFTLAEVGYLLRLANQRVLIERETESAIGLLRAADRLLADTEGLAAFELRRLIAADMTRLQAVPRIDTPGIYLGLGAIAAQVEQLRARSPLLVSAVQQAPAAEAGPVSTAWWAPLARMLERLADRLAAMVIVTREGETVKPFLVPQEVYYLRQNLILRLQQAQLALLKGDQTIYDRSLDEAARWLDLHFDAGDAGTKALRAELQGFRGSRIRADLPDLSATLEQARVLIEGTSPPSVPLTGGVPQPDPAATPATADRPPGESAAQAPVAAPATPPTEATNAP